MCDFESLNFEYNSEGLQILPSPPSPCPQCKMAALFVQLSRLLQRLSLKRTVDVKKISTTSSSLKVAERWAGFFFHFFNVWHAIHKDVKNCYCMCCCCSDLIVF